MDSDRTVVATFTPTSLTISLTGGFQDEQGNPIDGKVVSTDGTINCSAAEQEACSGEFQAFGDVTLNAEPAAAFDRWSGACHRAGTSSTCTLDLSGDDVVGAKFKDTTEEPEIIPPRQDARLQVEIEPDGAGKVTSSRSQLSQSIDCPSRCDAKFQQGEQATLTAETAAGSKFVRWQGGGPYCTTDATCRYPAFRTTSIKAVFELPPLELRVTRAGAGGGTVTSQPAGISCGSTCSASFSRGTTVGLSAQPDGNSQFAGWSDACSGQGACSVTLQQATSVAARFEPIQDQLQVTKSGTGAGAGTVTSLPGGIACGAACAAAFARGTGVQLHAQPGAAARFVGWSGACSGTSDCTLTIQGPAAVDARFVRSAPVCATRSAAGFGASVKTRPRRVVATIRLQGRASARLRLYRGRQMVVGKAFAGLGKGARTLRLNVPSSLRRGTYRVALRLTDGCGGSRMFTKNVTVPRR
jgi:hypothetical protein